MTNELQKAVESYNKFKKENKCSFTRIDPDPAIMRMLDMMIERGNLSEHALALALAELEMKNIRIKKLELKLDAYSTHNIERAFEKDKLVNRIAQLETAIDKAVGMSMSTTLGLYAERLDYIYSILTQAREDK